MLEGVIEGLQLARSAALADVQRIDQALVALGGPAATTNKPNGIHVTRERASAQGMEVHTTPKRAFMSLRARRAIGKAQKLRWARLKAAKK
jgi:hypothetical protein